MVETLWAPSRLGNTLGGLDVFRRWLIEVLCRDDGWFFSQPSTGHAARGRYECHS
jgi:hypothetical protein